MLIFFVAGCAERGRDSLRTVPNRTDTRDGPTRAKRERSSEVGHHNGGTRPIPPTADASIDGFSPTPNIATHCSPRARLQSFRVRTHKKIPTVDDPSATRVLPMTDFVLFKVGPNESLGTVRSTTCSNFVGARDHQQLFTRVPLTKQAYYEDEVRSGWTREAVIGGH